MPVCGYGPDNRFSSSPTSSFSDEINRTNVYVRKLPPEATDKDLFMLCEEFGKIVSTKAIIDVETNSCKGYGFVDFESPDSAALSIRNLPLKGYQAQIANLQELDPTNLYVGNLPAYITERDLDNMFNHYGRVISTRILRTSIGMSKRMGFARMESHDKCEAVIAAFNGKFIPGSDMHEALVIKYADIGKRKLMPLKLTIDKTLSQVLQPQQIPLISPCSDQCPPFITPLPQQTSSFQTLPQTQFTFPSSLNNFQFPLNTALVQPVYLQASLPGQHYPTQSLPGYNCYGTIAYQMHHSPENSVMQPVTIDNPYSGYAYYPVLPEICADPRYYFCGQQLVK